MGKATNIFAGILMFWLMMEGLSIYTESVMNPFTNLIFNLTTLALVPSCYLMAKEHFPNA